MNGWTPERIRLLEQLWTGGMSATLIAAELGHVSRNAILGKINRLGLSYLPRAPKIMQPRARKANRGNKFAGPLMRIRLQRQRAATEAPEATELPPDQSPDAVPFLDRPPDACSWPLWSDATPMDQRMVCGAPQLVTDDGQCSWCLRHARIGYAKLGDRRHGPRRRVFSHSGLAGYT